MTTMTKEDAVQHLMDIASRWAENAEEGFKARMEASDTDEQMRAKVDFKDDGDPDPSDVADAIDVRSVWRAIDVLNQWLAQQNVETFGARNRD